ncbi:riboflavin biosynthesis protein RibF [Ruminococcus sp.]|uniref:riboflavin biosynthesis protein RibF n=1 Tax=Ruminococcus sp. TaxID=41978 RepID=UPI0025D9C4A3|nr:riboflavin biosynthesis protein RibF [Ruminococcus sp.]MBO4524036.1 riboflavin biosynthesis protein RibF [Ruminococcus sp.]
MEKMHSSVALGIFDGVHLGHRAVINASLSQREKGLAATVFTFEPECALRKAGGSSGYIYTKAEKDIILWEQMGVDDVFSPPFGNLCGLSGEEFAREILVERMGAVHVCCGEDFRFGKMASCGVTELKSFGERFGFEVEIVGEVDIDGSAVSSSRIRALLLKGDIIAANSLLGFDYFLSVEVADGNHIGRTIGFPTINQNFGNGQLVPKYGVYSTVTKADGKEYRSITNVGVKPTIKGERRPLAETHIIGYSGDLYGKNVTVSFNNFVRPEREFDSLDELKKQINSDIEYVMNIF